MMQQTDWMKDKRKGFSRFMGLLVTIFGWDGTCYAQFIIASSVHGLLLIGSRLRVSNKNASPISRA